MAAVEFLLKQRRLTEVLPLLKKVKSLNGNYSKVLISRFYENLGLYNSANQKFEKAIANFKYALKVHKNKNLQSKLSLLEVGGTDIVENLILDSKAQVLIRKSNDFLKIGDVDNALRFAVQASDLSESNIDSKVFLIKVQLKKGFV